MAKALFFDIDGTLVSLRDHTIPASTVRSLEAAKANGAMVFVATGRPYSIINNLDPIAHLVDGYLTCNGAHCMVHGETIYVNAIPDDESAIVRQYADLHNVPYTVSTPAGMGVGHFDDAANQFFYDLLHIDCRTMTVPLEVALASPHLEYTIFISEDEERELLKSLPNCTTPRWHPAFTDIIASTTDKGKAVVAVAKYLGISVADTVGIGDGGNDIAMLQMAGTGIAMGNATDAVKREADFVTRTVDDDGVTHALRHLGLID